MGYTHYWETNNDITRPQWDHITTNAQLLIEASSVNIVYEADEPLYPPLSTPDQIRFNGIGNYGHETFILTPVKGREFCKTAHKPYDIVVVGILILANHFAPDWIHVSSDGDRLEWIPGLNLVHRIGFTDAKIPEGLLP